MSDFWESDVTTASPPPPAKGGFWEQDVTGHTPSHAELKAAHEANQQVESAAYKPGWFSPEMQMPGAIEGQLLGGAVEGIKSLPGAVAGMAGQMWEGAKNLVNPEAYKSVAENPIVELPGKIGAGLVQGVTEPLISPRTTGAAGAQQLALAAAVPLAKATGAASVELAAGRAGAAARRLVSSELKLTKAEQMFSKDPVKAVIEEKLTGNSLSDWKENVTARKQELLDSVQKTLAESNKTIPTNDIVSKLDPEIARIKSSVGVTNKETVLKNIETLQAEILDQYPDKLTLPEAHTLRKEIDDSISRWTPDAVEQSTNRAKYELRTGINREIESQAPGVAAQNRRASELMDVEHALDRRMQQSQRANIAGLGDIVAGGAGAMLGSVAGGVVGGAGGAALGVAAREALGSVAVKSRVANFLGNLGAKEKTLFQALPEEIQATMSGVKMSQVGEMEGNGKWVIDPKGEIHKVTPGSTHADWFDKNQLLPDVGAQLKRGYVRVSQGPHRLGLDVDSSNPNWIRALKNIESQTSGDNPIALDVVVNGRIKSYDFQNGQELRDWLNQGGVKMSQGLKELPADTQSETVIGYKPQLGKLVLNDEAMDRLTKVIGGTYLKGAEAAPSSVAKLKKAMPVEFKMVDESKPLTIQRVATPEEHAELARHEGTHRAAREVTSADIEINSDDLAHSKSLYNRAASRKAGQKYPPNEWTEEIFSDLATGNSSRLGMTRLEGLQLLGDMLDELNQEYGPEGVTTLMRRMAPKFQEKGLTRTGLKTGELSDFFPYTPEGRPWAKRGRQPAAKMQ
jgi:hypothetical protein